MIDLIPGSRVRWTKLVKKGDRSANSSIKEGVVIGTDRDIVTVECEGKQIGVHRGLLKVRKDYPAAPTGEKK